MKVELIDFYIKKDSQQFYSLQAPEDKHNYALYLGEDEEHTWIHPLYVGTRQGSTIPEVIIGSVSRFVNSDIVIRIDSEIEKYATPVPFGDMKHKGKSVFD